MTTPSSNSGITGGTPNRDPITNAPGAHPIGTGIGAAVGGLAAGAAAGTVAAGPVGTVVGAAVGAVAGGLAGKGIAELVDPTVEDAYWRENYRSRDYAAGGTYDDYGPAYRYGYDAYTRYPGKTFDEVEGDIARDWTTARGKSTLTWEKAKHATKDAWDRVSDTIERATPGDSDRDGK